MELFVVRHGIAEEAAPFGSGGERSLTEEGCRKAERVAQSLQMLGCEPLRIGTSPVRRARQTAKILADILNPAAVVEPCEFLRPSSSPEGLLNWLLSLEEESVMIVGHMSELAEIVSFLLAKQGTINVVFERTGVACLTFDGLPAAGGGSLLWLMQPAQILRGARPIKRG